MPAVAWGERTYPVPCFTNVPEVQFNNGKAKYRGFDVTADVAATGQLAAYESVAVHIVCSGASGSPSSILVYIGTTAGPTYVGPALTPDEVIDLDQASYVDGQLFIEGFGFTRRAPMCCPDLSVTKTLDLVDGALVVTAHTSKPLNS